MFYRRTVCAAGKTLFHTQNSNEKQARSLRRMAKGTSSSSTSIIPDVAVSRQESAVSGVTNVNALVGRELEWAKNSEELLAKHAEVNGTIVRTRFPPEPNGTCAVLQ